MELRKVFIEISDRLILAAAALCGDNLLEMQRDIIESQGEVIESQGEVIDAMAKVSASQDRQIVILTEWKDKLERLNALHTRHVKRLEKKADLQSLLIDTLKATSNYEEEPTEDTPEVEQH